MDYPLSARPHLCVCLDWPGEVPPVCDQFRPDTRVHQFNGERIRSTSCATCEHEEACHQPKEKQSC